MSGHDRIAASRALFERAARVIPGGIYGSKAPGFLVPGAFPYFIERAKGCRMWDPDGDEYIDYLCGFGSQIVGYGNERVDAPPARARPTGTSSSSRAGHGRPRRAPRGHDRGHRLGRVREERHRRHVAGALRGAREDGEADRGGGRKSVPRGRELVRLQSVPALAGEREDIRTFTWNDVEGLERVFAKERGRIACVMLTPFHHPTYRPMELPAPGFYDAVHRLCREEGALLVMDDIRGNFRLHPADRTYFMARSPTCGAWARPSPTGTRSRS